MNNFIGLCIVYDNYNYGSILQSYATLLELKKLGVKYEIIKYHPSKSILYKIKSIPRLLNRDMRYSKMRALKLLIGKKLNSNFARNDAIRRKKFSKFINDRFDYFSNDITSYNQLKDNAKRYTDVLVGSDQLWLPSGLGSNYYNLMFVPDAVNKISYAASFGVSSIPQSQKHKTKIYLDRIEFISTRENSGKRLVETISSNKAEIILDPTLIVTREDWDDNIEKISIISDKYIFCYFLGNNPEQRKAVSELKERTGYKIVTLRHLDEYIKSDETFGDDALFDVGPVEFLNLIRGASYICTDSFHGSVFSIIYHKQFISFNRYPSGKNSRNSRLDTLYANLGINRRFKKDLVFEICEPIDYELVERRIKCLRLKSEEFILRALNH